MDSPLPSPRTNIAETKKPIPTPRRSIKTRNDSTSERTLKSEECNNTLTRKVSFASKQIAGDISQLVQDKKKAVLEGTRQSVRRIARRFSSASVEPNSIQTPCKKDEEAIDFFSTIRFNSPVSQTENIYNNIDNDRFSISSEEDPIGLPPPIHPPPPLPLSIEEPLYDAPTSGSPSVISSGSGNSAGAKQRPDPYESVFPPFKFSESTTDNASPPDKFETASASESWKFYDAICGKEVDKEFNFNIVEMHSQMQTSVKESATGAGCDENSNISLISTMNLTNSLYENHEIGNTNSDSKRPSKSVILQFDPLNNMDEDREYIFVYITNEIIIIICS